MAKVVITLEDDENGQVVQTVAYIDGLDANSPAHEFGALMVHLAGEAVRESGANAVEPTEAPKLVLLS